MPVNKRCLALDAFQKSTREHGPRVLILSNVGMVGLNLACANILVMVVGFSIILNPPSSTNLLHTAVGFYMVGFG